jgi:putative membrane protein
MQAMDFKKTIGATVVALLSIYATAHADSADGLGRGYYHGPGMMWGGQWGGFGMVLGPILMILVLVGIVVGVIYLLRMAGWQHPMHMMHHTTAEADNRAMAILKERFAKGEIDAKEYEERKALLKD